MPDETGFPLPSEIIQGPGARPASENAGTPPPTKFIPPKDLSDEQKKAIELIMTGRPFVFTCFWPTRQPGATEDTGMDFWTALHGSPDLLLAAKPQLERVIDRLYSRRGIL